METTGSLLIVGAIVLLLSQVTGVVRSDYQNYFLIGFLLRAIIGQGSAYISYIPQFMIQKANKVVGVTNSILDRVINSEGYLRTISSSNRDISETLHDILEDVTYLKGHQQQQQQQHQQQSNMTQKAVDEAKMAQKNFLLSKKIGYIYESFDYDQFKQILVVNIQVTPLDFHTLLASSYYRECTAHLCQNILIAAVPFISTQCIECIKNSPNFKENYPISSPSDNNALIIIRKTEKENERKTVKTEMFTCTCAACQGKTEKGICNANPKCTNCSISSYITEPIWKDTFKISPSDPRIFNN